MFKKRDVVYDATSRFLLKDIVIRKWSSTSAILESIVEFYQVS